MKKSGRWNLKSIAGKVMLGFVFTAMLGSVYVAPSYGDNDHDRGRGYDHRRVEHRGHAYGHGRWHDNRGYRYYDDGYRERIYVEPPVFYAPPPEPGIRIFFPPVIIHH